MYALIALILIIVVITARLVKRWNMPLIILALGSGIIFGSDVTRLIYFDDAVLAQQIANGALIFVLFAGGFGTKRSNFRPVAVPSMLLATVGVLVTGAVTALGLIRLFGWDTQSAILISAIVSSTDAAAIFSILRTRSIGQRVASVTEIESAANDPMAIIMTTFIIQVYTLGSLNTSIAALVFLWQLIGGIAIGIACGSGAVALFRRIGSIDRAYYYILIIGIILFSFGIADICRASGMLSAFFAGFIMGNARFPFRQSIATFIEALSTIANTGLFVLLGLLVFPRQFADILLPGLVAFAVITLTGRPAAVLLCTAFSRFSIKEKLFLSWSGIRGAVPIVLATYPAAAGLDPEHRLFNIVFFAVTLSVLVQGTTIGKLADLLGLSLPHRPKPLQVMELVSTTANEIELVELSIDEKRYDGSPAISELGLPPGTVITLINRKETLIAPQGATTVLPGDTLFVLTRPEDIKEVNELILSRFRDSII